ncbi:MAG TPA: hypothetical protein VFV33_15890 [Gemmatimonadaceae bacterium]|nr:hypothetical protein [Gemmatimonadaceae bacterium]
MFKTLSNTLSRGMIVAASGWLLAACSGFDNAPTAPVSQPAANAAVSATNAVTATASLSSVNVLGRMKPFARPVSGSVRIGPQGGTILMPAAGLRLVVPPGAVDSVVTFSVTALAGNAVAYEFAPHGIRFKVPLQLQQGLGKTTWLPGLTLRGAYFKDPSQVDTKARKARVDEMLPAMRAGGDAVIEIHHFSGYLLSMG